jgi:ribonuclease P protein component
MVAAQLRLNLYSALAMSNTPKPREPQQEPPTNQAPFTQTLKGVRLRRHADYQRAYAASKKKQSASMSWFLAARTLEDHKPATELPGPRIGLTAGKVLGKAHERNRIKRRMREALRRHADLLPANCDLIIHPRRSVLTLEFAKLEAEIVRILSQAQADAARLSTKPAAPAAAAL